MHASEVLNVIFIKYQIKWHRLHQQSSLVQTITDNTGSHIDTRSQMLDRNLNLTELERKVRQANGLDSQHTHS